MKTSEKFVVVHPFRDLHDKSKTYPKGKVYTFGDIYYRKENSQTRIDELMGVDNKIGKSLIKLDAKKMALEDYSVDQLKDMAKRKGLEGYSRLKKDELIRLLEGD